MDSQEERNRAIQFYTDRERIARRLCIESGCRNTDAMITYPDGTITEGGGKRAYEYYLKAAELELAKQGRTKGIK